MNGEAHAVCQVAAWSTIPDMTTVFHASPYGRFIEVQSNRRIKELHRTNQDSSFLGGNYGTCIYH